MVQESPTEPDPDASDETGTESESSDEPSIDRLDDQRTAESSDRDDESGGEEAVEEAVSTAEDHVDDAKETAKETAEKSKATAEEAEATGEETVETAADRASEATDEFSEKAEELSETTNEMAAKTEMVVETGPNEEAALRRVKKVATLLDDAVRVPGTNFRVGLDPILGIVPGGGDAVTAALALYPVAEAYRLDAPPKTIGKMLGLIAVDFVLGSVPVLGVLFDAFWKANTWNARALERHLEGI
jgi:vacuolar-type H+-ATPase subunit H